MTATTLGDVSRLASDILLDDVLIDEILINDVLINDVLITTPGRFFRRTPRQHILCHRELRHRELCHRENPFVIEPFSKATRGP